MLQSLSRDVETFVRSLDQSDMLLRIDATTPSSDPDEVSYRYPFMVNGEYVAPVTYNEWDVYQGNFVGVHAAVRRLLREVKNELVIFERKPA